MPDGSFGSSSILAAENIGHEYLNIIYNAFKLNCIDMDYDDISRNPDNYTDIAFKVSGTIFQIIDEGFYSVEYLISTDYGYIYASWYDEEEVRGSRFLEDDSITVYGKFSSLKTYDTLSGQKTVPKISVTIMELN